MKRRILSMFLCLAMCLSLFPVGVFAAEDDSTAEEYLAEEISDEEILEETSEEELSEEETPAEEISAEEASKEEKLPEEEAPAEETPAEEASEEEKLSEEETPGEEIPAEEASEEEKLPEEEAPVEEIPVEEAPDEELPEQLMLLGGTLEEPDDQLPTVEGPVPYLVYENGNPVTEYCEDYTYRITRGFTSEETLTDGWYVFDGGSAGERITISGDVKIILLNDADCYFPYGIGLHVGSKLSIYAQPEEEGKSVGQLRTGGYKGGSSGYNDKHTGGAGIGGDYYPDEDRNATCGEVYIYGGKLDIKGGEFSAGIGGAGDDDYGSTHVGNGGAVYVYGGDIKVTGGDCAAGIGGGAASDNAGDGAYMCVYGGVVQAFGGAGAAGIGGGTKITDNVFRTDVSTGGDGGIFEMYGGEVYAYGGNTSSIGTKEDGGGAGIGGGQWGNGYGVSVYGGYLEVVGGEYAAGIGGGGGEKSKGGTFALNGGKVKVTGGDYGAAIGGGNEGAGGEVYLNNGELIATFGDGTFAIGGGDNINSEGSVTVGKYSYLYDLLNDQRVLVNPFLAQVDGNDYFLRKEYIHVELVSADIQETDYLAYDAATKAFTSTTSKETIPIANKLTMTTWIDRWYVVDRDLTIDDVIKVSGKANLILKNGCTLNATKGIQIMTGGSLTIYAQSQDESEMGHLIASGASSCAGIGGGFNGAGGTVTINGGYIEATGGHYAAGIGGGDNGAGGIVTINGGHIIATAGNYAAGIGGGDYGAGGTVTINGGYIEATGGYYAAGIGGGRSGAAATVTISSGDVEAKGGFSGAGIGGGNEGAGGKVTVNGGNVTAVGGDKAAGIGGGNEGAGGTVTINDGYIEATGGAYGGAGIGGGYDNNGGNVTLAGGTVTAKGGSFAAGIGGGRYGNGAHISIIGSCTVTAEAGETASRAIGNGYQNNDDPGTIEVTNGITVKNNKTGVSVTPSKTNTIDWFEFLSGTSVDFTANKGKASYYLMNGTRYDQTGILITNDAAIWSESWYIVSGEWTIPTVKVNGNVNIILEDGCKLTVGGINVTTGNSLKIYAQSQEESEMGHLIAAGASSCAGIGGGFNGACGTVTINGGYIEATGGNYAAGIGGGDNGAGGTVTINGGHIEATGGNYAAGIGGGDYGAGGTVTINGGYIEATGIYYAAGIGGGRSGNGGKLTLNGGNVIAVGGDEAAGIGGGRSGNGTNIVISGYCTVKAEAGEDAPRAIGNGINSGSQVSPGTISVNNDLIVTENNTGVTRRPGSAFTTDWTGFLSGTSVEFTTSSLTASSYYVLNGIKYYQSGTALTDDNVLWTDPWYVVNSDCSIPSAAISGHVNIILEDGCTLTVGGIVIPSNNALTIYAQSTEESTRGKLIAQGANNCAGIGAASYSAGGSLTVNGGYIEATGGANGSGIGGGINSRACYFELNEGEVVATGGSGASGIGGGSQGYANGITISGGIVSAKGGDGTSAIGGGVNNGGVTISITGCCTVEAEAGTGAPYALGKGPNDPYLSTPGSVKINSGLRPVDENGDLFDRRVEGWMAVMNAEHVFFRTISYPDPELDVVPYLACSYDEETGTYSFEDEECKKFSIISGEYTTLYGGSGTYGWYVVRDNGYYDKPITISGDVKLILMDGKTLSANKGIYVPDGSSLTIYAQSTDESTRGKLIATGEYNCAGIGGGGTITVNGGYVEATGGVNASGIGGAYGGKCGNITINAGEVFAKGGDNGAGIGGGCDGSGGVATINNGKVTAQGGVNGAGIGGGRGARGCNFIIYDGEVDATGGSGASGIGVGSKGISGSITLDGGKVTAQGGDGASAIGGGDNMGGASISITGCCTVEAKAGKDAPHAFGKGLNDMYQAKPGTVEIEKGLMPVDENGDPIERSAADPDWMPVFSTQSVFFEIVPDPILETVTYLAYVYDEETGTYSFEETECETYDLLSGKNTTLYDPPYSSGWYVVRYSGEFDQPITIDGDVNLILLDGQTLNAAEGIYVPAGSSLTIYAQSTDESKMGKLIATGATGCAGIGGIDGKGSGTITINGGYIDATGGRYAAGIGGGNGGKNGSVTVNGGKVIATGTAFGAGIGGGDGGAGGTVTVNGGYVEATGGVEAAGIGGGEKGAGGTFTINDGVVVANGGTDGAGIGGGDRGAGGTFAINGGKVEAYGGTNGAGIGGGNKGYGSNGTLAGGEVKAIGGDGAAGIGGGYDNNGANIKITGTCSVTVKAGIDAPRAIGAGKGAINPGTIEVKEGLFLINENEEMLGLSADKPAWTDVLSERNVTFSVTELSYLAYDEETGSYQSVAMEDPIMLDESMTKWENGAYFATGDVMLSDVTVNGDVILILDNGCKLEVTDVIKVPEGSSLTIYARSENFDEAGTLIVNETVGANRESDAGIGGGGNVTIHGGNITANGTAQGAGIGGSYTTVDYKTVEYNGIVTIYGGNITATGGNQAAGIGGGAMGKGTVRIYGGEITATGGKNGGAGIGGGYNADCDILIAGGDITATGGSGSKSLFSSYKASPGIGISGNGKNGTLTISGGTIHAVGGKGVRSSNIPDADAIMAGQIVLDPNPGFGIKVTAENSTSETFYPTKTDAAVFKGMQALYVETVDKLSRMDDGNGSTISYKIIVGANSVWTRGSSTELVITSDASFAVFDSVKIDGTVIDASNYKAESGSTRIKLTPEYLMTLSVGTHSIEIVSVDGSASTNFTIKAQSAANDPQTGDNSHVFLWVALLLVSGGMLAGTTVCGKKRKRAE